MSIVSREALADLFQGRMSHKRTLTCIIWQILNNETMLNRHPLSFIR